MFNFLVQLSNLKLHYIQVNLKSVIEVRSLEAVSDKHPGSLLTCLANPLVLEDDSRLDQDSGSEVGIDDQSTAL